MEGVIWLQWMRGHLTAFNTPRSAHFFIYTHMKNVFWEYLILVQICLYDSFYKKQGLYLYIWSFLSWVKLAFSNFVQWTTTCVKRCGLSSCQLYDYISEIIIIIIIVIIISGLIKNVLYWLKVESNYYINSQTVDHALLKWVSKHWSKRDAYNKKK